MAKLEAMRYKDFVWPHNPRIYTIDFARKLGEAEVPYGRCILQDMGFTRRILRGQGEFVGEHAYEDFKRLGTVFYRLGPGTLVHPIWQTANAYFTALSLRQEPRSDYVSYSFEFREEYGGYEVGLKEIDPPAPTPGAGGGSGASSAGAETVWHTVAKGETLWGISGKYGVALNEVIRLNPQIRNPNLIFVGERVRVK